MLQKYFRTLFAASGDRTDITDAAQVNGPVAYDTGYPPTYELDPATQPTARNVERTLMNGLFYRLTQAIAALQGDFPEWIAPVDNGGLPYSYRIGTVVRVVDASQGAVPGLYKSLAAGNIQVPGAPPQGATSQWRSFAEPEVPVGAIMMWSGAVASIPAYFRLCDGTQGTPDLRDRFVLGAGGARSPGAIGGSADAIVVAHTHNAGVTDPGHSHSFVARATVLSGGTENPPVDSTGSVLNYPTASSHTGISVTNEITGQSGEGANIPPFVALAYIIRVAQA